MGLNVMTKRLLFGLAALVISLGGVKESSAAIIDVSYTVSGSPGDYDLNFSVTNNMLAWPTQCIYAFGVQLSMDDITGSPSIFSDSHPVDFNPFGYGGTNTNYNALWQNVAAFPTYTNFLPGQTYSGFVAHIADPVAPTSVSWFAVSVSPGRAHPYTGGENYDPPGIQGQENPGFEGIASPATAVPEPASLALFILGLPLLVGRNSLRKSERKIP